MTCGLKEPVNTVGKPQRGRPREHDRDQIAIDLIEWAAKDDSINLCKFCALYNPPIPPCKITTWAKECDNFRKAYETAKLFLGFRREEMLNAETLHVKAYDLNATTYDFFLKDEKRQQAEFEAKLKSQEQAPVTEEQKKNYEAFISMLTNLQHSSSACKIDESKIKAEAKS